MRLDRPEARNAINTADARGDPRAPGGRSRRRAASGCWSSPRPTTWPLGRRRRPRGARRRRPRPPDGAVRPPLRRADRLSRSRPSPPATAPASAAAPRSPSPATCGWAARTCGCGSPAAALGVPVGPARLVTLCGLSVAKYLLLTAREVGAEQALRWGLVHRVAPAAATEEEALRAGRRGRRASAGGGRPPEAHAPRVGRRRGALPRRGRGPGGVAALGARASVRGLALRSRSGPSRAVDPAIGGKRAVRRRPGCQVARGTRAAS